jgi:hypothetical protein
MAQGKIDYLLVALFDHANSIEFPFDSRKVRENRVRKSYGRDSVELAIHVLRRCIDGSSIMA